MSRRFVVVCSYLWLLFCVVFGAVRGHDRALAQRAPRDGFVQLFRFYGIDGFNPTGALVAETV